MEHGIEYREWDVVMGMACGVQMSGGSRRAAFPNIHLDHRTLLPDLYSVSFFGVVHP
ncbi:MAG: hypothetical protein L0271_05580 [Gemmatimonadetes bacterium]|nr:hypothetical protein [Gemmatimonadota bacterium]